MLRLLFLLLLPTTISAQLKRFQFSAYKMGAPFTIIFYHSDSAAAATIAAECFSIVDSLNTIFSDYDPASETGRLTSLTAFNDIKVSAELFDMIVFSKQAWKRSSKTFDIAIGALSQLWRKAKAEKRFPSKREIRQANDNSGFNNINCDTFTNTISFEKQGIKFDFGAIVPGYAAQRTIGYLKSKNILHALVDASGDIVVGEPPPGKTTWSIAMNLPQQENEFWQKKLGLKNLAVATSGDVYRYTVHNGKKYSHIIDPRTGYGVTSQRNVTVIAKDGATADWLATACSILPVKKALKLIKKEEAAVFIATLINEKIVVYKSGNFDQHFEKKEQ